MTDPTELLPCPFCGAAAHFEMDEGRWEWVECESCGMQGNRSASLMEDCKPKLAEAWNRRTPPAVAGDPVFAFRRKGLDDFCTCTEERYAELSAKPNLFETRIFYTTPQPAQAQYYTPCRKNPFYHGPRNCIRGTVGCCEDHGAKPQAQAVAVPLTDGQIEAATGAKIGTPLFLAAKGFVLATEAAHGIKGGQHGTE